MKINKNHIFVFASAFILVGLGIYFAVRLVKSYQLEHPKNVPSGKQELYNQLLSSKDLATRGETYYFKGENPANYVSYSGRLWRIVSFESDHTIKLVTASPETLLAYDQQAYLDSYLRIWLNQTEDGVFYRTLSHPDQFLTKTKTCIDQFDTAEESKCSKYNDEDYVGILALEEYRKAGANNGYLNTKDNWWTSNSTTALHPWYIFKEGGVNINTNIDNFYAVYPTITLKAGIIPVRGTGGKTDPYILEYTPKKSLAEAVVGEYISFEDQIWRIVGKETDKIKIVAQSPLLKEQTEVTQSFSNKQNSFELKEGIGSYLNTTYFKTIRHQEYLVKGPWNIGTYESTSGNYRSTKNDTIDAYIGLLGIGDPFINLLQNSYTLTSKSETEAYFMSEDKKLYAEQKSTVHTFQPALYLDSTLTITEGMGIQENPYDIAR